MNSLKPLLIVAVLAGIGYGVYVRINSGNDAPPPGVAEGWDTAPKVQIPDNASAPNVPAWGPGGGPSTAGSAAPPFASRGAPVAAVGGRDLEAPAYVPPGPGNNPPQVGVGIPSGGPPLSAGQIIPDPPRGDSGPDAPAYAPPVPIPADQPSNVASAAPNDYGRQRNPFVNGNPPAAAAPANTFAAALDAAHGELEAGQMASALQQLSVWYDDPRLTPAEQQQLTQILDQVAGTVVYSTQHLLEPPYEVQPGERLEDIGQKYNVPWQLLAKINGIDDPQSLRPGERLKVVRGPFSAVISLEKRQLTLLVNGSYAGHFAIGIGREQPPHEGTFAVSDKVVNPVYHGRDRAVGSHDQNNPLGERWIGLGSDMGIHGTNQPENIGRTDLQGSISLSPRDIEDVYDILSVGSRVTIRR